MFRQWLLEKEKELNEFREFIELISLNEIFEYIPNYKEVTRDVYIKYRKETLEILDPYYLSLIDLEQKCKNEHGPRVHYYMYNNFLIYYGKFKYSNKYEVHFIDINNPDSNIIGGKNKYSVIFSVIMSILKDKHFNTKSDNIYIVNNDSRKISFYEVVIKNIISKYNINDWFVLRDRRGLVISKNNKIITERDELVAKVLLSQEDKELLDRLDSNNNYV